MKKENQKYIIILLMIILLSLTCGIKYFMAPKYEELPEVKLKDIKNKKSFAIMVQNGENYKEYNSDTWPGDDYVYKEAKCTDNNGNLVENAISIESDKVILETDKTVICTLYFDKSTLGKLRDNEKLANKDNLSSDLQGGMYRYQGTNNVANWICFGTTDNCGTSDTLLDKYMYRIIGITKEGQMYLIKETFVKEENETTFTWNDKYYTSGSGETVCDNKICPEWNISLLFKRINGTSNGTIKGTGTTSNNANTDIFVDSSQYDYLKSGDSINGTKDDKGSKWYQLIANHEWMYGDTVEYNTTNAYTGDYMYQVETGHLETTHYVGKDGSNTLETYKWNEETDSITAKISLMYIHDYVYSYYDGSTEESRGNPKNYDVAKNSWIHFQKDGYNTSHNHEWLSTRWGILSLSNTHLLARTVVNWGPVDDGDYLADENGLRPVFYLESKAKIVSGDGTKANPFVLSLN